MYASISLVDQNRYQSSYNSLVRFEVVFIQSLLLSSRDFKDEEKTGALLTSFCRHAKSSPAWKPFCESHCPEYLGMRALCLSPWS